ncbi:MAG: hypothetical protein ACYC3V_14790 [Chloroflexota bacterium]
MQHTEEGSSLFRSTITIEYYDPISAHEVAELVDELGSHEIEVRADRYLAPPMAQTYVDVAAICLVFASKAVLAALLAELGKAAWKKISIELYHLYKRAHEGNGYRYMRSFSLETSVDGVRVTLRMTGNGMTQEQFEAALETARVAIGLDNLLSGVETDTLDNRHFILGWDEDAKAWRPTRLYQPI